MTSATCRSPARARSSTWRLTLPDAFRQFDYQTINDVILNISYTAQQDGALRTTVETLNKTTEGALLKFLAGQSLTRVFSLRQDFSAEFARLLHSPAKTAVPLELSSRYFPTFLRGRSLQIDRVRLAVRTPKGVAPTNLGVTIGTTTHSSFTADTSLGGLRAKNVTASVGNSLPVTQNMAIEDGGSLAPTSPSPGDQSPVDEDKLQDLLLVVEYRVG